MADLVTLQHRAIFRMRHLIVIALLLGQAALVAAASLLPDSIAAVGGATVYLPLMLFKAIGLPVFGKAESGGWAAPSVVGWVLIAACWMGVWYGLVSGFAKLLSWMRPAQGPAPE